MTKNEANDVPAEPTVLADNLDKLLAHDEGAMPRMADAARAKMRAALIDQGAKRSIASSRTRRNWGLGLGALAVASAVAAAVVVTRSADELTSGKPPATPTLANGDDAHHQTLADGTTIILDEGATVEVQGDRHVRLTGRALLDVVPGKGRFIVETEQGHVEVLGTRFVVNAQTGSTSAAVVRGVVQLASSQGSVMVRAGEQGVIENGRAPTRTQAERLSQLTSWADSYRRQSEEIPGAAKHGTLMAREPGRDTTERPLPLRVLGVDVTIENQVARVALDQTFFNPEARELEGVYRFAIPADAALQRFAMYVDGVLTESAVIPRMQGRRIYEELVYRRIDPGLLEYAGAGRLDLRVYPLRAQQDKRLLLAYTQTLPRLYSDWTLTVPLPEVDGTVEKLQATVRIKDCGACELSSPSHAIKVAHHGGDAVVTYAASNVVAGDSLVLRARDATNTTNVTSKIVGDKRYLLVRKSADLPTVALPESPRRRSWVLLHDVSASRGPVERAAQATVIARLLHDLDEEDRVAVIAFDVGTRTLLPMTRVLDVNADAVARSLRDDEPGGVGATDLAAALTAATTMLNGVTADNAHIVYLGDGVVTNGARKLETLRPLIAGKATFIGVGIGDGVELPVLEALSAATGGLSTTFDLADDVGYRAYDLVASLYTPRAVGVTATFVDGTGAAIADATAYVRSSQLSDGDELELVGRVPANAAVAALQVTGTVSGQPWQMQVPLAGIADAPLATYLPRLWAGRRIGALMLAKSAPIEVPSCIKTRTDKKPCATEQALRDARDEVLRKEIVALGVEHFLLSRHTSLLVLENDAMYAKYGVKKGAGVTWAPYDVPAKIPVIRSALLASEESFLRTPLQLFSGGDLNPWQAVRPSEPPLNSGQLGLWGNETSIAVGALGFGRMGVGHGGGGLSRRASDSEDRASASVAEAMPDASAAAAPSAAGPVRPDAVEQKASGVVDFGKMGWATGGDDKSSQFQTVLNPGRLYSQRLRNASDSLFVDLSAWIPAMYPDDVTAQLAALREFGSTRIGTVTAEARTLINAARSALPRGGYQFGSGRVTNLGLDGALMWTDRSDFGLEEVSRFDGTTWSRSYPELGVRTVRRDESLGVALGFARLPLLVPSAESLATVFDVKAPTPTTLTLTPTATGSSGSTTLTFDTSGRLLQIVDANGAEELAVNWNTGTPLLTRYGTTVEIHLTPSSGPALPTADLTADLIEVDLPMRGIATQEAAALAAAGTPAWRGLVTQALAAAAAKDDQAALGRLVTALVANNATMGPLNLGEVTLASAWLARQSVAERASLRGASAADTATLWKYLEATQAKPSVDDTPTATGLLSTLRIVQVGLGSERTSTATAAKLATLLAKLPASDLTPRLIIANASRPWEQQVVGWDSIASGPLRNMARLQAAQSVAYNYRDNSTAKRYLALMNDYDLAALPVSFSSSAHWQIVNAPGGESALRLAWASLRARVIASDNYEHLRALLTSGRALAAHDTDEVYNRTLSLAGNNSERLADLAGLGLLDNRVDRAAAALAKVLPRDATTRIILRLRAAVADAQGQPGTAAGLLSQALAQSEKSGLLSATDLADYPALFAWSVEAYQRGSESERDALLAKSMDVVRRWRRAAPGNRQIDQQVASMLYSKGDSAEAWRQLSTAIELTPMDGAAWAMVADTLEKVGQSERAVDVWQEAVILDQTNPTPRLRQAQLYFALGRNADGASRLAEINSRRWHDQWWGVTYQAKQLASLRAGSTGQR